MAISYIGNAGAKAAGVGLSGAATLGISAAAFAAEQLIKKYVGAGRKAADKWVKGTSGQDEFHKNVLAPAAEIAKTDPERAKALVADGWKSYLDRADAYASQGKNQAKVIQQNLTTPSFMNTVKSLLGEDPLDGKYTGSFIPSGGADKPVSWSNVIAKGLGAILPALTAGAPKGTPPYNPNAGTGAQNPPTGGGGFEVPNQNTNAQDNNPFKDLLLPTLVGTGANLLAGWLQSRAAGNAATTQSDAALAAAALERQTGKEALDFSKEVFNKEQENIAPWLKSGAGALTSIEDMLKDPKFSWDKQFVAPDPQKTLDNPAVKFALEQGRKAIDASAAAKGTVLSPTASKAQTDYAQGTAYGFYDDLYGKARDEYATAYNTFSNERAARLNPLQSLAGIGQTAVGQSMNSSSNAADRNANIGMTTAARVNDQNTDAASATASGYANRSNAWTNALQNIANGITRTASDVFAQRRMRYA